MWFEAGSGGGVGWAGVEGQTFKLVYNVCGKSSF